MRACWRFGAVLLGVGLVACGEATTGAWAGPPVLTLRGVLLEEPGRAAPQPVRVSLLWAAGEGLAPTMTRTFTEPWPVQFEFPVTALPPRSALVPTTDGGLGATATLVAWVDGNGNGVLDRATAAQPSPDRIVGSARSPEGPGLVLAFFEGSLPCSPSGLQRGFNLLDLDAGVLAYSTPILVVLSSDPRLSTQLCATAAECTPEPLKELQVFGTVGFSTGMGAVDVEVKDTYGPLRNAVVQINGRAVPFTGRRYSLLESGTFLRLGSPDNVLSVTATGYRPLTVPVALPGLFSLISPALGGSVPRGDPLSVAWSASSGVQAYEVQLFEGDITSLYKGTTTTTSMFVPFTSSASSVLVNVSARGPPANSIYPYVSFSRRVAVQP
jgi:hypothetical protein